MNDNVDTNFSEMHSNFILLKEKENKLNYEFKKEKILQQKSQNLPEHIIEKYSNSSKFTNQIHTINGIPGNHFGSVSGMNISYRTSSPDKKKFKSNLKNKIKNNLNTNQEQNGNISLNKNDNNNNMGELNLQENSINGRNISNNIGNISYGNPYSIKNHKKNEFFRHFLTF